MRFVLFCGGLSMSFPVAAFGHALRLAVSRMSINHA
jgi:hypothetical protein